MLSVYSGTVCLGHLLNRGKLGWEAIDADDRSLGLYPDEQSAARAIPDPTAPHPPQHAPAKPRQRRRRPFRGVAP
jgi:hypothetical protein